MPVGFRDPREFIFLLDIRPLRSHNVEVLSERSIMSTDSWRCSTQEQRAVKPERIVVKKEGCFTVRFSLGNEFAARRSLSSRLRRIIRMLQPQDFVSPACGRKFGENSHLEF